ncbi:MAG: SRPBCC domain-containing protein [Nocardiopsaceae bacterium]|nr:SRPBCC domain-containing protein [Nocardiopsaceae bacterium]
MIMASGRPPVRQSVLVRSTREHTFETFAAKMGEWWPVNPFSAGKDRVRHVTVERHAGGRVYETWADGTQVEWGTLLAWDPPHRLKMTWAIVSALTEVELTFTELGPSLTRVSVIHAGWEKLSAKELAADCALTGGYLNGSFDKGWALILGRLAAAT